MYFFSSSDELSGSGESSGDIDKFDKDENTSKKIKKYFLYCLTVMQYWTFVNILYFLFSKFSANRDQKEEAKEKEEEEDDNFNVNSNNNSICPSDSQS